MMSSQYSAVQEGWTAGLAVFFILGFQWVVPEMPSVCGKKLGFRLQTLESMGY
jgi:hypothetical protein